MTKTIDALVEALAAPGCERIKDFYSVGPVQRAAVESFVEALAQARAEQAETVAESELGPKYTRRVIEALYENADPVSCDGAEELERLLAITTTPPAAPVAKLDPLTDAELDRLIEREWGRGFMPNQLMAHRAFARAIEAAHNAKLGGVK